MVSSVTSEEALGRLRPEDRAIVETFRDRVREQLGPRLRDLRLYGSKVRGDDHEESDIDVLVLVQDLDRETNHAIFDLALELSFESRGSTLSANIYDFERYHAPISRASGFYESMRHESVRL